MVPRPALLVSQACRRRPEDLGDLRHLVPCHQQFEDLLQGLWRVGPAIRHLPQGTHSCMWVRRDCVGGELMWVHGFDVGLYEDTRCPEPRAAIVGDDGVGLTDDRRVGNVAVIDVVEAVAVLAVLVGGGCPAIPAPEDLLAVPQPIGRVAAIR
jgi:hypothetical protein